MSCFHGNHPDACDICDEVDAASKRGYEAGFKACLRENFTTPPQRKPLTQDGTMEIANQTAGQYWMDEAHIQRFRAAVEAAHGIKENT